MGTDGLVKRRSSEVLNLSRALMKHYDDNLQEINYLKQKMSYMKESLSFMYSRTDLHTVRTANVNHERGQSHLHETLDGIDKIEKRLMALISEQENIMAFLDKSVSRDYALVIRGYHELGLNYTQIGELYHMGRSTANRRYWSGMEALGEAMRTGDGIPLFEAGVSDLKKERADVDDMAA